MAGHRRLSAISSAFMGITLALGLCSALPSATDEIQRPLDGWEEIKKKRKA